MPNDAKIGLLFGVAVVVVVAVLYFKTELFKSDTSLDTATPSVGGPAAAPAPRSGNNSGRNAPGRTTSIRRHVVAEGETLFTIAQHYYGDGERFIDLYQANRAVLKSPDALPKGTELVIPDLDE